MSCCLCQPKLTIGETLIRAIAKGDFSTIRELYEEDHTILEFRDVNRISSLHYAAQFKQSGVFQQLLRWGASPGALDLEANLPLHYAAYSGCSEIVKTIVAVLPQQLVAENICGSFMSISIFVVLTAGFYRRDRIALGHSQWPVRYS